MRLLLLTLFIAGLAVPWLIGGCASGGGDAESHAADDYSDDDDDGGWAGDDDAADDDQSGPAEEEDDFVTVQPSAADVYVFIANPNRDSVTKVQVLTRQITTIEVGDEPSQVLVTSDYERAVVFNDGEDSVSVIDVDSDEVGTVDVREDFNYMTISPSGQHAVCYLNTALLEGTEPFQGVLSYTEVSIVDLDELVSHDFSVGFNPKQVKFANDGDLAVIISDEYITVVDLTAETPTPQLLDLGADPFEPPVAAEVEVEPDGQFAFIRYENDDLIQVVDLADGSLDYLFAGSEPTDIDLSPDGTELMVVARSSQELFTFDTSAPGSPLSFLSLPQTEAIGSLAMAPVGDVALLYTTATLTDRVTVWDRASGATELTSDDVERLVKPVDQVIMAPDGESVLVVHTLVDVPGDSDIYSDHHALTIVSVGDGAFLPNAVLLEDELESLANFDDGETAVFMMANNRNVGVIDYPSRLVDDVQVPSYPVHVGVMPREDGLPEPVAWISQDHPLGRISFADPASLEIETVTGFELNSGIE